MDLELDLERFLVDIEMNDEKNFVGFKDGGQKCGFVSELCEEKELNRKRKRDCYLIFLDWVKRVAKNPCDLAIGFVPKRSKWKAYGSDEVWKQVLLAKEAMQLKVNVDSNAIWEKNLKMHPDMYDDQATKLTSRCSQRLVSAKKPIPLGQCFQAEIPPWIPKTCKTETKWLGTHVWPLEKPETRTNLIEKEQIGKGRKGLCRCQFLGSLECVRFHVSEKRFKIKLELGSAFVKWKFDKMGEEVSRKWSKHEEKMFAKIINSNPKSLGTSFWDEITTYFKNKTRSVLVSYYFNVYLLRRRAHQNRSDLSNVDSDDDELERKSSGR